jgi:hypothetical protein
VSVIPTKLDYVAKRKVVLNLKRINKLEKDYPFSVANKPVTVIGFVAAMFNEVPVFH